MSSTRPSRTLGDVDVARSLEVAELHVYPGDRHLFTDDSLPSYDEQATNQVGRRVLDFLDGVKQASTT